jgi:hypothetical protein
LGGVEEEEKHIDEDFQGFSQILVLQVIAVVVDSLVYVQIDHLDELRLVLCVELQGHLLKTIDDQAQSILFGLVLNQLIDLLNEEFSGWHLEVRVEVICQSFCVVGDDFNLEFRHGRLHDLVDHPIHHFVGVCLEQIFQKMQVLSVLLIGLVSMVHLLDGGV